MSVRAAKTQISLGIHQVWSESLLCAQWVAKDPSFLHADSKDSEQTGHPPRLIWVFAGRTLILLVLSCRGSYMVKKKKKKWILFKLKTTEVHSQRNTDDENIKITIYLIAELPLRKISQKRVVQTNEWKFRAQFRHFTSIEYDYDLRHSWDLKTCLWKKKIRKKEMKHGRLPWNTTEICKRGGGGGGGSLNNTTRLLKTNH